MRRKVIAMQFCPLDREAALRNCLRIANNEPEFRKDVEFVFAARFDCPHDPETIAAVSKKFKVHAFTSSRKETGWPGGCNALWCDFVCSYVLRKWYDKQWSDVQWVFTMEADCIPIHPDWINKLDAEWLRKGEGKLLGGCWMPQPAPTGHVNGNMMVAPNIGARLTGITGCPSNTAWDYYFAKEFAPHWFKSYLIVNFYKATKVTDEQIEKCYLGETEPPVVIHGVKDLSVEKYAARKMRSELPICLPIEPEEPPPRWRHVHDSTRQKPE